MMFMNVLYTILSYTMQVCSMSTISTAWFRRMSKFSHPNVMKLIGVCIDTGDSPYIVMPYMVYGSLLSYLKKHRAELTIANDDNSELARIGMHVSSTKAEISAII